MRSARSVQAPVMMGPVTRREQPLGSASSMIECLSVETGIAPIGTFKESLHWPLHITVFRESSLAAMVECDTAMIFLEAGEDSNLGHDHGRSRFAAHGELLRIIVHCGDHGGQHLIAKDRVVTIGSCDDKAASIIKYLVPAEQCSPLLASVGDELDARVCRSDAEFRPRPFLL
ncbi:hypothetical protein KC19_4G160200 [Ceratodon purpureus]|uniref:Uncharacterized protein n=1 Tax=Ceratodon purpureus TaxID=3225 RepID=A0A8T0ICN3_CERPU|nr:hypothetical protein KC19_4G160200 [Ceratodon purpureus]